MEIGVREADALPARFSPQLVGEKSLGSRPHQIRQGGCPGVSKVRPAPQGKPGHSINASLKSFCFSWFIDFRLQHCSRLPTDRRVGSVLMRRERSVRVALASLRGLRQGRRNRGRRALEVPFNAFRNRCAAAARHGGPQTAHTTAGASYLVQSELRKCMLPRHVY